MHKISNLGVCTDCTLWQTKKKKKKKDKEKKKERDEL